MVVDEAADLVRHLGQAAGADLAQVEAGAERLVAGAGDDGDVRIVVVAEVLPRLDELLRGRRIDAVHDLRPVDRDVGYAVALLVEDGGHTSASFT